ncbi:TRAP transporter large permease subunit [Amorphus sp. 3PC139-8]|uniref:TRAP transporter large permease n=1 Tax=Amorphus sp. 3PC139-8 TaxID=2735676 RepID=UPI00345C9253
MLEGIPAIVVGVGLLLGLMLLGLPVFIAFLTVNLLAVGLMLGPSGYGMFIASMFDTTTTNSLVTIPMFILMGEILFRSNAVDVLFHSIDTIVGKVRGRQYVLTVLLATIFSTLSGAAMGVAAMLSRSLLPTMVARGYDSKLAIGNILAGASLAPLIPPSILAIIVGMLAGVSISGLLIAGILPGLMFAVLFLGYTFIRVRLDPSLAPSDEGIRKEPSVGEVVMALVQLIPFSIVIISVIGLILMGIATPTEAGAMGVLGALVTAAIYRRFSLSLIKDSTISSARIAAMILIIMATSKLFSQLLAFTGGATALTQLVAGLDVAPWLMIFLLMALPFILCMFIDQIALMLIVVPIYIPILNNIGVDPLWFWLLFLINITVGGMTPPFGYTLFALKSGWEDGRLAEVFSAAWPFVFIFILGMVLLAIFPGIVTFLPSLI